MNRKITRHLDVAILDEAEAFAEASGNLLTRFFRKIYLHEELETLLALMDGEEPPHVVIVEREFPYCPWQEAVRKIREGERKAAVLLMGPEALREEGAAIDGYVRKPIEKNQLVRSVAEGVRKRVESNGFTCQGVDDRRENCRFEGGREALAAGQCPFA